MKKWIYRIALVAALSVFAYSAYQLYTIYQGSQQVSREQEELAGIVQEQEEGFAPDWEALRQKNPDIIGWVYVPGCDHVSFPIVQGADNEFYLDHPAMKENNIRGAIFLDAETASDFSQENNLIYGHSVDGGGMFTSLDRFEDQAFFDTHRDFYILTPQGNYRCPIVAFAKTEEGSSFYLKYDDRNAIAEHVAKIKAEALYTRDVETEGKTLVTLSTCDLDYGFDSINRLVLVGVMEPTSEPVVVE
ncbi:class B sortase [uncultured Dubosiella sp.]|uniref:class B sortase n=1 Tax=uncultured Dubosiella sp. TaxID=1937011 RepID=UPI002593B780|nr:class B sortase [uncultured Dubosiella sp.]